MAATDQLAELAREPAPRSNFPVATPDRGCGGYANISRKLDDGAHPTWARTEGFRQQRNLRQIWDKALVRARRMVDIYQHEDFNVEVNVAPGRCIGEG